MFLIKIYNYHQKASTPGTLDYPENSLIFQQNADNNPLLFY